MTIESTITVKKNTNNIPIIKIGSIFLSSDPIKAQQQKHEQHIIRLKNTIAVTNKAK